MNPPRALDLFCGAGGATRGLQLAGFHVTGVDLHPQPRYCGDAFHQADAMAFPLDGFDFIWASPPCQRYTRASFNERNRQKHQDLVGPVRQRLQATGLLWTIENVDGSPLNPPCVMLCGLMFGLKVFRHRWFESNTIHLAPSHPSHRGKRIGVDGMCCVIGNGGGPSSRTRLRGDADNKAAWQRAMGIDWMTRDGMAEAIPPAYARWVGEQMLPLVLARKGAA